MFEIIWDTRGYFFWLWTISLAIWIIEQFFPWRKEQPTFRKELLQDVFWLFINGHYIGILVAYISAWGFSNFLLFIGWIDVPNPEETQFLLSQPYWIQFIVFFLLKDFAEWCVHNTLHRVPWLWEFHKLHHSIKEMDFIGNFRFHWMEIVVYNTLKYLPLVMFGVSSDVILPIAIISTIIGHLNHANIKISWGPFKYILNSPRMHIWHHDVVMHKPFGQNFGIVFSIWDWIFRTVYWPADDSQPERIGFEGDEDFPSSIPERIIYPIRLPIKSQNDHED